MRTLFTDSDEEYWSRCCRLSLRVQATVAALMSCYVEAESMSSAEAPFLLDGMRACLRDLRQLGPRSQVGRARDIAARRSGGC